MKIDHIMNDNHVYYIDWLYIINNDDVYFKGELQTF